MFKTAIEGKLNVDQILLIQDYMELKGAAPQEEPEVGRPRASTQEAFDKFEGETS
jgi:hypothetical protein